MTEGRPTLGDVASAAGVHKATASRALAEATAGRVHPATVRRVREAAAALGYRPNVYARGLRTRSTRTIGVVLTDIAHATSPSMVRGIEETLGARGFSALYTSGEMRRDRERAALDELLARQVDGILLGPAADSAHLVEQLTTSGTPVVALGIVDAPESTTNVEVDDANGVADVVEHLVRLGHRAIAHVAGPAVWTRAPRREEAFRQAFADHGLDPAGCPVVVAAGLNPRDGAAAFARVLALDPGVTAVAAYDDTLAVGVLRGASEAGLSCPGELSVVGFNDQPLVGDLVPALTTVRVPTHEMGATAARMLLDVIDGGTVPTRVSLPVVLVPRESSGPVRARSLSRR